MSRCPLCGRETDPWLLDSAAELRPPIYRWILRHNPGWRREDGICPDCALEAARAFALTRSAFPLNDRTEPHTTFPYYHPEEETVLGLAERLPFSSTFSGRGVTLAFLDSGYYPHPDLCEGTVQEGLLPDRLSPAEWRALVEPMTPRLANYIDLTGDKVRVGSGLKSLWDGEGVAWHGQMTTTIAAGNGSLSSRRYRGPASDACLLPIKIGRGDGHIPEPDIQRGFAWLLADETFARYDVRVVNVSIGGDYPQEWRQNPVCLAAEALVERGVVVVAAAGNQSRRELLAPAQAPSVITVGGVDDQNRPVDAGSPASIESVLPYHHNHAVIHDRHGPQLKPEVLAPGRYVASPILPVSPILREMHAIGRLRRTLRGSDNQPDPLVAHWQRVLRNDEPIDEEQATGEWMGEVWQAVRQRMNAHKWVHSNYQHVDGTSVSTAVVSGVVAQMIQANPWLTPHDVRAILRDTALPLSHVPPETAGAGLIQPTRAVAASMRRAGGPLAGYPYSGSRLSDADLRDVLQRARVPLHERADSARAQGNGVFYFGLYAPAAASVHLTGDFNQWSVSDLPLARCECGWWHAALTLPQGHPVYRFIVVGDDGVRRWLHDPENPLRAEGGYLDAHSRIDVD